MEIEVLVSSQSLVELPEHPPTTRFVDCFTSYEHHKSNNCSSTLFFQSQWSVQEDDSMQDFNKTLEIMRGCMTPQDLVAYA